MRRVWITDNRWVTVCYLLVAVLLASSSAQAQNYYRYRNTEGQVVIDMSVPPEHVANGYEIINRAGSVIEVVPPHKPVEQDADQQRLAAEQEREDKMLLRSYSSISEIEAARDRRLSQLQREVDIVDSNQEKNKSALATSRGKVANLQRSGKPVSENLLSHIDDLEQQIKESDQLKQLRQQEYQAVSDKYARYIRRFAKLKGLPQP